MVNEDVACEETAKKPTPAASTLIEFPGAGRAAQPPWRKELNERVREIQERRSREAEREERERQVQRQAQAIEESSNIALGLVPQRDQPPLNPIVAAALKRIERAQQPLRSPRNATRGGSVAVARVVDEEIETCSESELQPSLPSLNNIKLKLAEPAPEPQPRRPSVLSVVQPKVIAREPIIATASSLSEEANKPNSTPDTVSQENELFVTDQFYDDCAPYTSRLVAGVIDLFVVAFASSPFAAIIELSNSDWTDTRVVASMGAIFLIVMFLYLTTSTATAGRTWGMSLLSLRAVDVDSGLPPTTKQSVTRAVTYILSLAVFGLGILYALVDAERRGIHDHFSGTTVVRE
jgi:uncharacterized RDD family membrane protein YckC